MLNVGALLLALLGGTGREAPEGKMPLSPGAEPKAHGSGGDSTKPKSDAFLHIPVGENSKTEWRSSAQVSPLYDPFLSKTKVTYP